ncbi:MAG: ATP-binding protein [Acidimicrobiales bacterium]
MSDKSSPLREVSGAADPAPPLRRGSLRVYLGAAPGVGKTFAMLNEGRRAKTRGADVVVGFVESHGRAHTAEQLEGHEVIARRSVSYRGSTFEEMNVDAILERHPERVLIDELAHTNVPGSRNEKRWQDVEEILEAGIDVISTVNIQHLESLNDVVERITDIRQGETIPDRIVRGADQVELVDQTPEALRRRMAHGNVYAPDKVDTALANYFRTGNLGALRELALLWIADKVDVGLEEYRERHGITEPWETRERVVVAITGAPGTEALIRRAARIAQRAHGELLGVHVVNDDGLATPRTRVVDAHRRLLEEMGGQYHEVVGGDVGSSLVDFARAENSTQLVLGASNRSRWSELLHGSIVARVVRLSGPVDVHVISHEPGHHDAEVRARATVRRSSRGAIPVRRQAMGWGVTLAGVPLLTLCLAQLRQSVGLPTVLLLFLAIVVTAAAVGGTAAALAAAVGAFLCANWFFTPPYYRLTIAEAQNVVALAVFLGVALLVSRIVDTAARRASDAALARSEAQALARMAATMGEDDPLPTLLDHLMSVFGLDGAALLTRCPTGWAVEAGVGNPVPSTPEAADLTQQLTSDTTLALSGAPIAVTDKAVLNAFATQLAAVIERRRLRLEAGRAGALAEANALRSALLQAVSHDLRTPLAAIKASANSLRQPDIEWPPQERDEFLRTIEEEADRLTRLVEQLLDMSRIQAGALRPALRPVALEEVVPAAVREQGTRASLVEARLSETIPAVEADAALLERALANVVANAVRFSVSGKPVRVEAGAIAGRVDIRIIDQGPGIPREARQDVFQPFQRLDDRHTGSVGLGLAVARGFLNAMNGTINIDDTPGGGTTVVISLPMSR